MRTAGTLVLILAWLGMTAAPAYAGERAEGHGWGFDLPPGFVETMSMEGASFNVSSRFGTLPVDGVPEMKAFVSGNPDDPKGVLIVSRIDLKESVLSTDELGMDRLHEVRDQLPAGARIEATNVGTWNAVEMVFIAEMGWDVATTRMLVIAAGDYCVMIMLMTHDEMHPDSAVMWATLKSSIEIDPPMSKWLLFGLIGFGALGALWLLGRVNSRQVREIPDHSSRFKRADDVLPDGESGGLAAHTPMQTGVRPKVLPSSGPRFDATDPGTHPGAGSPPPPPRATPPAMPPPMPAPTATSPAVTRPPNAAPPGKAGLRPTRPTSGRWGQ